MPLTSGTRLGPYEIVCPIGAGGMGEVYRARDPRLGRDVAIKVLPESLAADPARLKRFEQEARAVAAISHPNILAIFDIGAGDVPFLVTELLEGGTLRDRVDRGPIGPKQTIELAMQLVSGLIAAHARGIVHRDLKPQNVFVTNDGIVKILDFGLAKSVEPVSVQHEAATMTSAGIVLGTVGYMAPEQIRGEAVDPRADLFAVGAILYEMATGERAFRGDSPADTMSAVLREQPPDLALRTGTPPALARIVRRCLEKSVRDRFQSARDLAFALESISDAQPATAPAKKTDDKSVAVLPFANMSADAENQYFSDGLAEELINALTRLPGLRVASRTSAFRFRGRDADIRQIGHELQVGTVLEGSVRRSGNRLRVTAQLTNVEDGFHIWSERYDREMADVFDIQDEIVGSIVKALAPALARDATHTVKRPTENLEAYELYLKGRHYWHQRSPANIQAAVQCFERVIALDPDYALAYAGLADCYAIFRVYGWYSAEKTRPPALAAAARALELDASLAEVHYSQALVTYYFDRHWRGAEAHLRRALAINPQLAMAQGYLAIVLASDYRVEESQVEIDRAVALDPLSPFIYYLAASALWVMGRANAQETMARRILELAPDSVLGLWSLTVALTRLGRHDEAIAAAERVVLSSRAPFYVCLLARAYAAGGRRDDAQRLLGELAERASRGEYVVPAAVLTIQAALGDREQIVAMLRACIEDQTPILTVQALSGPELDALRGDPEIDRLLDELYDGARPPAPL